VRDLLLHEQYVAAHLEDRVAARALVDHIEEARGVSHRFAIRTVARIRKHSRDAVEMAAATALLRPDSGYRDDIIALIREAGPEDWRTEGIILVVPGDRYPTPHVASHGAHPHDVGWTFIRIGARRVLKLRDCIALEREATVLFDAIMRASFDAR
jgi:hypothetical protein